MNRKAKKIWDYYFGERMDKAVDALGILIVKADYGNADSRTGWVIDHIRPKHLGGSDELRNLRPLNIRDNCRRQTLKI